MRFPRGQARAGSNPRRVTPHAPRTETTERRYGQRTPGWAISGWRRARGPPRQGHPEVGLWWPARSTSAGRVRGPLLLGILATGASCGAHALDLVGTGGMHQGLCWLVTSTACSEAPRLPHRGSLITAPVSKGLVHGPVHSFQGRMSEPASAGVAGMVRPLCSCGSTDGPVPRA